MEKSETQMSSLYQRPIKRVLLLMPPINPVELDGNLAPYESVSAPAGLCYIAALLRKEAYSVSILDATAEGLGIQSTVERIIAAEPDIVGVSCHTSWVFTAHEVMKRVKAAMPRVCTVAGGPHVTAIPERTLEDFPFFDVLVVGEGEITFRSLIEAINDGTPFRQVNGIAFREDGRNVLNPPRERIKNLDELPPPAYDLLPKLTKYYWPYYNNIRGKNGFSIIVSRGCPYKCNFCDNGVFGNLFTKHSPEYVVDLIEDLVRNHGVGYLVFDDDNLLLNKNYLLSILELMKKRHLNLPFTCASRVDTIDEERLEKLRDAGCKLIMFGMESGSQKILSSMNKKTTTDQIRHAVALTKQYNIDVLGYFILGYPGETEATMQETVDFVKRLKLDDIAVQPFVPFPGAPVYRTALEEGTYEEDWREVGTFTKVIYEPYGLTNEIIVEYLNKCIDACYNNLRTYLRAYRRVYSFNHFKILMNFAFRRDPLWTTGSPDD